MLSTGISMGKALRAAALTLGLAALASCGTTGPQASDSGVAVDPGAPVRVALLVPTGSGDPGRESIGRSLINAAQLAQSDLQNAQIDLAIYPTSGTTGGGSAAASQAVAEGAAIILGPLFSTATAGAEPVAAAAGITMLSMSNNIEVAGPNVFVLGSTFQNTADSLVGYGMAQGLRNYGIVYPSGLEGETARDAAASAVSRRGASVVASESYGLSVEAIEAAAPGVTAALNARGANAVILTDGPTGGLGFISEALRANGLSPASAQFLGMQRWDVSAEALSLGSLQGGVFAAPDPALVGAFEGRYRNAYGEAPHELAGLAYDGIAAIGALISEARASGGSPFSEARLTQPAGFAGVNGAFRLLPDGTNQRNLAIYEVRGGQAVMVRRAARSFDSLGN
jgi:ABC-type branched-subunit amino acid transport system substrate-binding protein